MGMVGHCAEEWNAYIQSLTRVGLCRTEEVDHITRDGRLNNNSVVVADSYRYIMTTSFSLTQLV